MADLLLALGPKGIDLQISGGDLMTDDSLVSAVIVSLFTDRLAEPGDELPARGDDRRGWWADSTLPGGNDRVGSRLWLLDREKQLAEVLVRARRYAEEALSWLVDEKRVRAVSVAATNPSRGLLLLRVTLTLLDGDTATVAAYYDYAGKTYTLAA